MIKIDDYNPQDLTEIADMIKDDAFIRQDIISSLNEYPAFALQAKRDGKMAAVAVFTGIEKCTGMTMYVKPEFRKRGIGTKLLTQLERKMRKLGVEELVADFQKDPMLHKYFDRRGFKRRFDSNYMEYRGSDLPLKNYNIIQYEDTYYTDYHDINSRAFYKMLTNASISTVINQESEERRKELDNAPEDKYLLLADGNVIGVVELMGDEIDSAAVRVENQRKGYGTELIHFAVNEIKKRGHSQVHLWCVEGNPAKHLYERTGFRTLRVHEFVKKIF